MPIEISPSIVPSRKSIQGTNVCVKIKANTA